MSDVEARKPKTSGLALLEVPQISVRECLAISGFWSNVSVEPDGQRSPRLLELSNVGAGEYLDG